MPETFLIHTEGGPRPGDFAVDETQYPWPLPGILRSVGGVYVKVSESQAPPQEADSRLVRAARYHWYRDDEMKEARSAQAQD